MIKNQRNIPAHIRKELREEVYWGCPVEGCGSPLLSYHHYKPPWHIGHSHTVEGMIALCLPHHKEADAGVYTEEQLDELKRNPYLKKVGNPPPKGGFNYKRKNMLVLTGGNILIGSNVPILFKDKPIAHIFTHEKDTTFINLIIINSKNEIVFQLFENEWITVSEISDLVCPPSNTSLKLSSESEQFNVEIKFKDIKLDDLEVFMDENQLNLLLAVLNNEKFNDNYYMQKLADAKDNYDEYEMISNKWKIEEDSFYQSLNRDIPLSALEIKINMGVNPTIKFSTNSIKRGNDVVPFIGNLVINSQIPIDVSL